MNPKASRESYTTAYTIWQKSREVPRTRSTRCSTSGVTRVLAWLAAGPGGWAETLCFIAFSGGEGEIRTHEPRKGPPVFKTGAFNRSATSPTGNLPTIPSEARRLRIIRNCTFGGGLAALLCPPYTIPSLDHQSWAACRTRTIDTPSGRVK